MNKLNKEKRNQLAGIYIGTAVLLGILWSFGVQSQQGKEEQLHKQVDQIRTKLSRAEAAIRQGPDILEQLKKNQQELMIREAGMADDRDPYAWILNTMNRFIANHNGIQLLSPPGNPDFSDMKLLPAFFYRSATYHVRAVGCYHDFGRFCADLENEFPFFSIQNMEIIQAGAAPGKDNTVDSPFERLEYHFDIVTPIKPSEVPAK